MKKPWWGIIAAMILLSAAAQSPKEGGTAQKNGVVGYWSFDGFDGKTVVDDSGNKLDGTIAGNIPTSTVGMVKNGLAFDGKTCIALGNNPKVNLKRMVTLAAWVKPDTFTGYPAIFGKGYEFGGAYSISIREDGHLWFEIDDAEKRRSYFDSETALKIGTWAHVAATYDGTVMQMYINGELVGELEAPDLKIQASAEPLRIGWLGTHGYFKGMLDEVRLYDYALSQKEINALAGK